MSVIKLPHGDGTWETLKIPNIAAAITPEHDTYNTFNIGFDNTTVWKSITTPYTYKPADMTQSSGNIPIYMPYEGSINTGIQVVYGTVGTDIGKIWMRRCDSGVWGSWALVAGEEMTKATGAEIDTGTDDTKYVTSKAIADSNLVSSSNNTIQDIKSYTLAEYTALSDKTGLIVTTDEEDSIFTVEDLLTSTSTTNALSANQGKVLNDSKVTKAYPMGTSRYVKNIGENYFNNKWCLEVTASLDSVDYTQRYFDNTETVLFYAEQGYEGTVTLSETSANFSYLEIYYRNNDGYYDCKKIYNPNGKKCGLNLTYYNTGVNQFQHWSGTASISGTTITHTLDYYTSNSTTATSINYIYIVRVVGYR